VPEIGRDRKDLNDLLAAQDAGELPGGLGTRDPEGGFGAPQGDMVEKA
jgi:hypothetical protein